MATGRAALVSAALALLCAATPELQTPPPDVADTVREAVRERPELVELYQPLAFRPLWAVDGDPTPAAHDAARLLASAADEGLDAADYDATTVRALLASAHQHRDDQRVTVGLDIALSAGMLRYLRDLHAGRIDPRVVGFTLEAPRDVHDFTAVLRDAVLSGRVIDTARAWRPRGPQYPALSVALARYRELARSTPLTVPLFEKPLRPGDSHAGVGMLRQYLVTLGDLDAQTADVDGELYAGPIVDAVRHFQRRHGLEADGIIGTQTAAALAVPLEWRVRQLELAMERLRWLPHEGRERLVLVNIPMFRVFAWDTIPPAGAPAFSTGVIVGRAIHTETPVFSATLSEIIFRPYWNVPSSIVRKEILPKLPRDPGYLDRERMELVAGQTDTSPVVPVTADNLEKLRAGTVRLRQRPGPANSLGLIKFSFPNENDVYMHATPARALFAQNRRDFSHGCVRVEDPVGLAVWVLAGQDGWDRDRIVAAMEASQGSRLRVADPPRVILLYATAAVMLDSGDVAFADDIYQRDGPLDDALKHRRALVGASTPAVRRPE